VRNAFGAGFFRVGVAPRNRFLEKRQAVAPRPTDISQDRIGGTTATGFRGPGSMVLISDISSHYEREQYNVDFVSPPFRRRNYGLFGFLAGVRNHSRKALACRSISTQTWLWR
jgi:hypothetical protein